jgi:hypothetical protein
MPTWNTKRNLDVAIIARAIVITSFHPFIYGKVGQMDRVNENKFLKGVRSLFEVIRSKECYETNGKDGFLLDGMVIKRFIKME